MKYTLLGYSSNKKTIVNNESKPIEAEINGNSRMDIVEGIKSWQVQTSKLNSFNGNESYKLVVMNSNCDKVFEVECVNGKELLPILVNKIYTGIK